MILEMSSDENLVLDALLEAGLNDLAVIVQMVSMFGVTTRIFSAAENVEATETPNEGETA